MKIDEFPTREKDGIHYTRGHALPFGASLTESGAINFSVYSAHAFSCTLVLFHKGDKTPMIELDFPKSYKIGDTYAMMVFDLDIENVEYGYRFDGPYNKEKGYLFDQNKIILDPYAKLISGLSIWRKPEYVDSSYPIRARILQTDFDWQEDEPLQIPMEDLIIYEMHVRGFTRHPSSKVKYPGTYAGIVKKIPYLKSLGINCIELLPVFEFDEKEYPCWSQDAREVNYWGYSTVGFFAPKAGYAVGGPFGMAADEFKNMVKKLHQNHIEVILDVVFNHTAEMDHRTISYRGIDASTYYLMKPDGTCIDFSGCGNTVNCNHPVVRNQILDCLRYWVSDYHIDGFRFDEAPILSRDVNGNPMTNPPLLESLALDPILSKTKLIAEAWDAAGLYQVGNFPAPKRWADWNGKFRDCVRHFIKSDGYVGPELILRMQGSPDMYSNRTPRSTVNFVTCHDGFTLNDVVSYNEKHNMANGEQNKDGMNDNLSWNCGIEGPTENPEVEALRTRNIKNAMVLLFLSRGTPMFCAGDEFRNTQMGNNNAYCQDNEISWLDWARLDQYPDMFIFFQKIIQLRKNYPVLRKHTYKNIVNGLGYPEMSFHGSIPWQIDMQSPFLTFGILYSQSDEQYSNSEDCFIYAGINSYWQSQTMTLPIIPEGFKWKIYIDTNDANKEGSIVWDSIDVESRSSVILIAKRKS